MPALAALEVREVEHSCAGIVQRPARPDAVEIVERLVIAGQQQVVAVVDDETERRIEIGPTTASRERRSLMHDDPHAPLDKAHSGAQAGDARADDMDARRQSQDAISQKSAKQAQPARLDPGRGGAKPSFSILSRIEP